MTGRTQLLQDAALRTFWIKVTHDPLFDKIVVLARAELCQTCPEQEQLKGANAAIDMLATFTESESDYAPFPGPGLIHRPTEQPKKEQKKD